jgi:hypothetical protein
VALIYIDVWNQKEIDQLGFWKILCADVKQFDLGLVMTLFETYEINSLEHARVLDTYQSVIKGFTMKEAISLLGTVGMCS